ncbi:MAG: hypothetical protein H6843_05550 [Rhodospirillaceae bacterium]|nr:hypothetical protein [Rhodospirillaceae bacterium]
MTPDDPRLGPVAAWGQRRMAWAAFVASFVLGVVLVASRPDSVRFMWSVWALAGCASATLLAPRFWGRMAPRNAGFSAWRGAAAGALTAVAAYGLMCAIGTIAAGTPLVLGYLAATFLYLGPWLALLGAVTGAAIAGLCQRRLERGRSDGAGHRT